MAPPYTKLQTVPRRPNDFRQFSIETSETSNRPRSRRALAGLEVALEAAEEVLPAADALVVARAVEREAGVRERDARARSHRLHREREARTEPADAVLLVDADQRDAAV